MPVGASPNGSSTEQRSSEGGERPASETAGEREQPDERIPGPQPAVPDGGQHLAADPARARRGRAAPAPARPCRRRPAGRRAASEPRPPEPRPPEPGHPSPGQPGPGHRSPHPTRPPMPTTRCPRGKIRTTARCDARPAHLSLRPARAARPARPRPGGTGGGPRRRRTAGHRRARPFADGRWSDRGHDVPGRRDRPVGRPGGPPNGRGMDAHRVRLRAAPSERTRSVPLARAVARLPRAVLRRSGPAHAGLAAPPAVRDVRILDADYRDRPIGVMSESGGRQLTAVLACRVVSFSLLDAEAQERRLSRWGLVLSNAASTPIRRIQWIERTAPAQGDELARWLHAERDPTIPLRGTPMIESYLELIGSSARVTQEHEILLAVQIDARRVRERGRRGRDSDAGRRDRARRPGTAGGRGDGARRAQLRPAGPSAANRVRSVRASRARGARGGR